MRYQSYKKRSDAATSIFTGSMGSKTQSLRGNLLGGVLEGFVKDSQRYGGVLSTKVSCENLEAGIELELGSEFSLRDRKPLAPFD